MKKITIEFESKEELEYHLELVKKGSAYDDYDEYLRQLTKYSGIETIVKDLLKADKKNKNHINLGYEIIYYLRERLHSGLD
jgi:hypothetical protein